MEKIIAEGYHKQLGGPHAEVEAFNNAKEDVAGGTLYVNLEPCSHYGRTPPCAQKIIDVGIKKVVAAIKDPNPKVSGRGFEMLKNAGIEVEVGVLEEEAIRLNEIFITYIVKRTFCNFKNGNDIGRQDSNSFGRLQMGDGGKSKKSCPCDKRQGCGSNGGN